MCLQRSSAATAAAVDADADTAVNSDSSLLQNSPSELISWYQSLQAKLAETTSTLESFVKDTKVDSCFFAYFVLSFFCLCTEWFTKVSCIVFVITASNTD